jgi:AcrR family transcriptional regulator
MAKSINDLELKEVCIQAAREVIAAQGTEGLSMRDVARKLNISHQAPYKHFPSRDHLLAKIMRRCFEDFAQFIDAEAKAHVTDQLRGMGEAYLAHASLKPLEYRLMFGTPCLDIFFRGGHSQRGLKCPPRLNPNAYSRCQRLHP